MPSRIRRAHMTAAACAVVFLILAPSARAESPDGERAVSSHLLVGVTAETPLSVHVAGEEIPASPIISSEFGVLAFTFDDSGLSPGAITVSVGEPPDVVIADVSLSDVTPNSAVVTWRTSVPANSLVEYGETAAYGAQSPLYPAYVTEHSVALGGLSPGTVYHFSAVSEDAFGGSDRSDDGVFETPLDPLVISDARIDSVGQTWAAFSWTTNRPGSSRVEYGETVAYGSFTPLDPDRVTEHAVTIVGLSPGTEYHLRALSDDGLGFSAVSDDQVCQTEQEPLAFDGVGVAQAGTTWATVVWSTSRPTDSRVEYGLTEAYGSASPVDSTLVTDHEVTLTELGPGTVYHFRVGGRDAQGTLVFSEDHQLSTQHPPLVISDVVVSLVGPTYAVVEWATDRAATGRVDYGETADYGWSASESVELVAEHSKTLAGLSEGTLYHFRVASEDADGLAAESSDSTFVTLTSDPTGPPIIDDVLAEESSATSVTITWTTDRPATSRVLYGTASELDCSTVVDSLGVTSHSVTVWPVAPRVTYCFVVESACATGSATCSEMAFQTTTPPGTDPQAKSVDIVRAYVAALAETCAVVRWATDRPCSSWVEYGATESYGAAAPAFPLGECAYEALLTGLSPETAYHYRVGAWDEPGGPVTTEDATFTTPAADDSTAPSPPQGVSCGWTERGVEITWTPGSEPDLAGYYVYRARQEDDEADWSRAVRLTVMPVGEPPFLDTDIEEGSTYSYAVTAIDLNENESAYSETVSAYVGADGSISLELAVYPNPVRDEARFGFTLPPGVSDATLRVLSVTGRVVGEFSVGGRAPGQHTITWDGRDPSGWPAGSGIYLCELRAGGAVSRRKVTLLRAP